MPQPLHSSPLGHDLAVRWIVEGGHGRYVASQMNDYGRHPVPRSCLTCGTRGAARDIRSKSGEKTSRSVGRNDAEDAVRLGSGSQAPRSAPRLGRRISGVEKSRSCGEFRPKRKLLVLADLQRTYPDINGKRHFLVTEVTRMGGGQVCVASIDLQTQRIKRPLQWNHKNWSETFVAMGLHPGAIVRQRIRNQQEPHGFPHQTEDTQLTDPLEFTGHRLSESELFTTLAPTVDVSVGSIFNDNIVDCKYVVEATKCRSLGSVMVDAVDLRFTESYGDGRLTLISGAATYDLKITDLRVSKAAEEGRREAIVAAIQRAATDGQRIIVRVGLARAWQGPNGEFRPRRCYVQSNGLIFQSSPGF